MAQNPGVYPPNDKFPTEIAIYVVVVLILAILVFVFVSIIGGLIVTVLGAFFGAAANQVLTNSRQ